MVKDNKFKYDGVCSERKNANVNESNPINKQQREQGCLLKILSLFMTINFFIKSFSFKIYIYLYCLEQFFFLV